MRPKPSLLKWPAESRDQSAAMLSCLKQMPHWMFTFTGSATDLVLRTLTLITSTPSVQRRVIAELEGAGPLDGPAFEAAPLPLLEACLHGNRPPVPAGHPHLSPRRPQAPRLNGLQLAPGTEIMHLFPLFTADLEGADAPSFNPDRWLAATPPVCAFDPFLGGARRCPGRSLILVVCKTALASLLLQHRWGSWRPASPRSSLPAQFPAAACVCGRVNRPMPSLVEDLVPRRLVVRHRVHVVPQRQRPVHPLARPALVAERAVLGECSATGCTTAAWRIPSAPASRSSAAECAASRPRRAATASRATARAAFSIGIRCGSVCICTRMSSSTSPSASDCHHRVAQVVVGRTQRQPRDRACACVVFGQTEYCIAWPSPSR